MAGKVFGQYVKITPMVRSVATPEVINRLRAFVTCSQTATVLEQHLVRPRYRSDFTLVAEQAAQIVGYVLLAHTRWRFGALTLEVGTLEVVDAPTDEVFTALIGAAMQTLADQGLSLALCTGALDRFGRLGFAPYRWETTATWTAGQVSALRPAHANDLETLAALYDANYADLPLTGVRAAPDWRWWLAHEHEALVLDDGRGRTVAYAVLTRTAGAAVVVSEAGAADAGAARTLLNTLSTECVTLALPLAHRVMQAALHDGGVANVRAMRPEQGVAVPLAGVVDLSSLLTALVPAFELRLSRSRYADWSGVVQLETATEQVPLIIAQDRVRVAEAAPTADVRLRRVALPALTQLCLGYRAAAALRATDELRCDDADLGLIDVLFPVVL